MLSLFIEFLADALFKGAITLKDTGNGARRPGDVPEAGRTQTRKALVRVIRSLVWVVDGEGLRVRLVVGALRDFLHHTAGSARRCAT